MNLISISGNLIICLPVLAVVGKRNKETEKSKGESQKKGGEVRKEGGCLEKCVWEMFAGFHLQEWTQWTNLKTWEAQDSVFGALLATCDHD